MTKLGAAVRQDFLLEDGFATANHGAYGATPRPVLAAQDEWRARMERQPSRFFNGTILPALRNAADQLGALLGARGQDIGFVGNATEGANGVLRSLRFEAGDEILVQSNRADGSRYLVDSGTGAINNSSIVGFTVGSTAFNFSGGKLRVAQGSERKEFVYAGQADLQGGASAPDIALLARRL
jgi:hypothetical protein